MKSIQVWRWPILLLILLISADLMFIGLEIIHTFGYASDNKFSLGTERGYSEVYQYVKFFWVALLLAWLTVKMYQPIYGIGSLLFLYLLLDDPLDTPETAGGDIVACVALAPALSPRGNDDGDLAVAALAVDQRRPHVLVPHVHLVGQVRVDADLRLNAGGAKYGAGEGQLFKQFHGIHNSAPVDRQIKNEHCSLLSGTLLRLCDSFMNVAAIREIIDIPAKPAPGNKKAAPEAAFLKGGNSPAISRT
jgi:hypothetical protein